MDTLIPKNMPKIGVSGGALEANIGLLKNDACVAARITVKMADREVQLRGKESQGSPFCV